MISNCLYCPVYELCGYVIDSVRLCRAITEEVQTEAYLKQWLKEQSQIPESEVLAFFEELEYYAQMYEELFWADYFMHEIMKRDI